MTEERKQEIIDDLFEIYNGDKPDYYAEQWTMFTLLSLYLKSGKNKEKINGNWVMENCPEPLRSLEP